VQHETLREYSYSDADLSCAHAYLLPRLKRLLAALNPPRKLLFDLGCGNGAVAHALSLAGWEVVGVDPSEAGVRQARNAYPNLRFETGSCYDPLRERFGTFPVVLSLEVIEHVYAPRAFARCVFDLLEPEGVALISTPYHGYLKNLALALTGRMDAHFTALWDHGHIKFWSLHTMRALLEEAGFEVQAFHRVGRIPWLAKSFITLARRPKREGS
jgi:2-polyprenyl-3-methyl-5-hydroxy-6-metoxy-1,4-benzoquinol methylase